MRITNTMMSNNMLLALNKNARAVDKYYMKLATGKNFQQPSEDPISASRALRFRTNVSDTVQYQKNTSSATAWMEVTDTAFSNVNEMLRERVTYLLNQGSNDTYSLEDRKKIAGEIASLVNQMGENEMNANNAGRYVFSGYKTDEPPILTKSTTERYNITQTFSFEDNWNKASFQKPDVESVSSTYIINELNLAYANLDAAPTVTYVDATGTTVTVPVVTKSLTVGDADYDADAYNMSADASSIHYIKETGELVMGEDVVGMLMENDFTVNYDKTGFTKGEPNPKVYFDSYNYDTKTTYTLTDDPMLYGVSIGTDIQVNSLARNVFTDNMYAVLTRFTSSITEMNISTDATLKAKYEKMGYSGAELDKVIEEQKLEEQKNAAYVSHNLFNGMLGMLDMFVGTVSTEHTALGTKMNRADLIDNRLGDDEYNFTKLMSDNEDADYMDVIMRLNSSETTYQAAMQVGAKVMQLTLINFL